MKLLLVFATTSILTTGAAQISTNDIGDILGKLKNKHKEIQDKNEKTIPLQDIQFNAKEMGLNELLDYALDGFKSIKGPKVAIDDYGTGGDTYAPSFCLKGASKCKLNFPAGYGSIYKARFGGSAIGWEETSAIFDSLYTMMKREKLIWGKTAEGYGFENGSGKLADFTADINDPSGEKYKGIKIRIETIYIKENEYQVVLTAEK